MTATEHTAKVRRIAYKLNKLRGEPGYWLLADALKSICQELEAQRTELEEHHHRMATAITTNPPMREHVEPWLGKAGHSEESAS